MIDGLLLRAINHALKAEAWARERLRGHAGRRVRLAMGPWAAVWEITADGLFESPAVAGAADVAIELPADAPFRLPGGKEAVFAAARISGPADLAESLGIVLRHLRWDAEDDLSRYVGDIAARRLMLAARAGLAWQRRAFGGLAANAAEYLGEEAGLLLSRPEFDRFSHEVDALGGAMADLERRMARLAPLK